MKKRKIAANTRPAIIDSEFDMNSDEVELHFVLSQRHCLPKELMESVRKQVELALPSLVAGRGYTLKKLCGKEFWMQLARWQTIVAGQCMAYMVADNRLPVTFAGRTRGNSQIYRLK